MKIDYKKSMKEVYAPKAGRPVVTIVPKMRFLMVSGLGKPDEAEFAAAAATVMPMAYVSKFIAKEIDPEDDFVVPPMEVKWRLDRSRRGSGRYSWTLMVMQPPCVTDAVAAEARARLASKGKELPLADRLRLRHYEPGPCGQILHIGGYGEPMERRFDLLKAHLEAEGYEREGDSQDIYFNDARRCPPERLKTLIRVRIWPKGGTVRELDDPFEIP
jgi:hypothetical protein